MDVQQFEQAILKLAFETDARITTASVAYYLGIPSRDASQLLNQLLEDGVLELDSDHEGNLFYCVPDKAVPQIKPAQIKAADEQPDTTQHIGNQINDNKSLESTYRFVSLDDDAHDVTPIAVASTSPGGVDGTSSQASEVNQNHAYGRSQGYSTPATAPHHHNKRRIIDRERDIFRHDAWQHATSKDAPSPQRSSRFDTSVFGTTSRFIEPDASLNKCGASPIIVNTTARCEPQPLADSKPVVTSCVDNKPSWTTTSIRDDYGFGFTAQSQATALVAASQANLTRENPVAHIEQPEHQPGMALLLSLILCGTGQIYNGEVSKGIVMMVLCFLLWFVLLGWVVHIWSIVDSVVVAERINRKPSHN